jgi:energy-coupling factor transporter transmembrane protein EcfT
MTSYEFSHMILSWVFILICYLLRNTPFGFMWKWMKMILILFVGIMGVNYAKKNVKAWWNKD